MASRTAYQWFMLSLQDKKIMSPGDIIMNKRQVFEELYAEGTSSQVELQLVISGVHDKYYLAQREDYNSAVNEQQYIDECTREELAQRALSVIRQVPPGADTLETMVEAMLHVLENHIEINRAIRERIKKGGQSAAQDPGQ